MEAFKEKNLERGRKSATFPRAGTAAAMRAQFEESCGKNFKCFYTYMIKNNIVHKNMGTLTVEI